MCATNEGKQKGEKWCKRAIWENTLPEIKRVWKSVENLTSGIFLNMWQNEVNHFYARYSEATKVETSYSGHARPQIAKLFANDQLETPKTAVSEAQPTDRGTVNFRHLVSSLKRASHFYARYSGATKAETTNSSHARPQIAKLFANDQPETPRTAVSFKEDEAQPADRRTVNSRDLVSRIVPSWCRGLNNPNRSVCGPVHLISQMTKLPKDVEPKSHIHLVRTSSP
jgi:hypothetical protein